MNLVCLVKGHEPANVVYTNTIGFVHCKQCREPIVCIRVYNDVGYTVSWR